MVEWTFSCCHSIYAKSFKSRLESDLNRVGMEMCLERKSTLAARTVYELMMPVALALLEKGGWSGRWERISKPCMFSSRPLHLERSKSGDEIKVHAGYPEGAGSRFASGEN
jgi:hypothetical protein